MAWPSSSLQFLPCNCNASAAWKSRSSGLFAGSKICFQSREQCLFASTRFVSVKIRTPNLGRPGTEKKRPGAVLRRRNRYAIQAAYISPPAADPNVLGLSGNEDRANALTDINGVLTEPATPISWSLIGTLLFRHKLGLVLSVVSLAGSTACTLTMPFFSGKFFEFLVGASSESLWGLLSKVGTLYILEPIFTIMFVINMSSIWEKVMLSLRSQIFRRILIQKVEFFDRHKVGELTGLLTTDLGSVKDVVSENISRDRGFRAFSEASYYTLYKG